MSDSEDKEIEKIMTDIKKSSRDDFFANIWHLEKFTSFAIKFHDSISGIAKFFYQTIVPPKLDVPLETAQSNMDTFAKEAEIECYGIRRKSKKKLKKGSLEEKLETLGDYYLPREEFTGQSESVLWQSALAYDLKGIIPAPHESLEDFVYRGNSLLFIHQKLKESFHEPRITAKERDVKLDTGYSISRLVTQDDLKEANQRIPYFMDLSWVAVYVKEKKEMMVPALGLTFTLPQYNGFNFVQMLSEYKSREQFVNVLAHELTHAGTVHSDTKTKYLETKAYSVGKGDLMMGEYVVAVNSNPPLWMLVSSWIINNYIPFLSDHSLKVIPKVKSAITILTNTAVYREVEKELQELYGDKGGYFLGRLNADEMEEFRYTNNIPARMAMKDDLKWRIMHDNFLTLDGLEENKS